MQFTSAAQSGPRNLGQALISWHMLSMALPSGKHTKSYRKNGPFIVDLPIKMVIFHSYVKLPEGTRSESNCTDDGMDVPQDLAIVQPSNRANKNNVFLAVATMKGNMYFAKACLSTCGCV